MAVSVGPVLLKCYSRIFDNPVRLDIHLVHDCLSCARVCFATPLMT